MFIRIITFHRDGGGPLLEPTSVKKVIKTLIGNEMLLSQSP